MLKVITTKAFEKNLRRMKKRGKPLKNLEKIVLSIAQGKKLSKKYRDHKLVGNYIGCRECHIEPDWLLVYRIEKRELHLIATGTHSDLF